MKDYSENKRFLQLKDKIFKYRDKFTNNESIFIKIEFYYLNLLGINGILLTNKTYFNNSSYFNITTITMVLDLTNITSDNDHMITSDVSTTNYISPYSNNNNHNNNHNTTTTNNNNSNNDNNNTSIKTKEKQLINDYRYEYAKKYVKLKSHIEIIIRNKIQRRNSKTNTL